jgi:hypothetical protein
MVVYAAAGAILFGTSDYYAGYASDEIPWEENCPSGLPVLSESFGLPCVFSDGSQKPYSRVAYGGPRYFSIL